jgi:excisionase family DNA binding protein
LGLSQHIHQVQQPVGNPDNSGCVPQDGRPSTSPASQMPARNRLAYSVAEVAALLGLSTRHVSTQLKSGAIPSIRLGRRVLIPVAGLDDLLHGSDGEGGDRD